MEFIPIDSFTKLVDNRTEFFIYGKSIDRKRVIVRVPSFYPYFYLKINDTDFDNFKTQLNSFRIQHEDSELFILETERVRTNYYKISINRLTYIEYFALRLISYLKQNDISSGFDKLQIKQKYDLFNHLKINSFKLCSLEINSLDVFNYADLKTDYLVDLVEIKELRNLEDEEFDYYINIVYCDFILKSGSGNRPIWMINSRIRSFNKIFQWKNKKLKNTTFCDSENDLLEKYSQFLNRIRPDILILNQNDLNTINNRFRRYGVKLNCFVDKDHHDFKLSNKKGLIFIDLKTFYTRLNLFEGISYESFYKKFFHHDYDPVSKDYLISILSSKTQNNVHLSIENNLSDNYNFFTKFFFHIIKNISSELTLPVKAFCNSTLKDILYYFLYYKYKDQGYFFSLPVKKLNKVDFSKIDINSGIYHNIIHLDLTFMFTKLIADNNVGETKIEGLSLNKKIIDTLYSDLSSFYRDEFSYFLFNHGLISFFDESKENLFDYSNQLFFKYLTKLIFYDNLGLFLYNSLDLDLNVDEFQTVLINELDKKGFKIIFDKNMNYYISREVELLSQNSYFEINNMLLDLNLVLSSLKILDSVSSFNLFLSAYIFDNDRVIGLDYDLELSGVKKRNIKILEYMEHQINYVLLNHNYFASIKGYLLNKEFYLENDFHINKPLGEKHEKIKALFNNVLRKIKDFDFTYFLTRRKVNFYSEQFKEDFKYNDLSFYQQNDEIFYVVIIEVSDAGTKSKKIVVNDVSAFREKLSNSYFINHQYYIALLNKFRDALLKLF